MAASAIPGAKKNGNIVAAEYEASYFDTRAQQACHQDTKVSMT
jgi:hypothetical protein